MMKLRFRYKMVFMVIFVLIGIVILFLSPYSVIKSEYGTAVNHSIETSHIYNQLFNEEDISNLPTPVKKYFRVSGFTGKEKMYHVRAVMKNAVFQTDLNKPKLKINFTEDLFSTIPTRFAFIDSNLFGIPFQGMDSYYAGKGSMKGVIGKLFTLFNVTGKDMDRSAMITFLAESLIIPTSALDGNIIKWTEIDDTHVKATMTYNGISSSGIFSFNKDYTLKSFYTNERYKIDESGVSTLIPWSVEYGTSVQKNGYFLPSSVKIIWHCDSGEFIYFNSDNLNLQFYK